eukprot:364604-Chlamydomonas_euryale.AAC.6
MKDRKKPPHWQCMVVVDGARAANRSSGQPYAPTPFYMLASPSIHTPEQPNTDLYAGLPINSQFRASLTCTDLWARLFLCEDTARLAGKAALATSGYHSLTHLPPPRYTHWTKGC